MYNNIRKTCVGMIASEGKRTAFNSKLLNFQSNKKGQLNYSRGDIYNNRWKVLHI